MPKKEWESLNTKVAHKCPAKAEKLAKLLSAEKGVTVSRGDAVNIALDEAIAARTAAAKKES